MKIILRIILIVVILCIGCIAWALYTYPFLSPTYRAKYSAEAYAQKEAALSMPANAADILSAFDALYPYWLGTRWDFNGTSQVPGEGQIACGYFVTTMIEDMHIPINRIQMAQCASEEMIMNQIESSYITRYNAVEHDTLFSFIRQHADRLYIIGLDNHTGFIRKDHEGVWFIHSSGRFPFRVIKENAETSKTIRNSKYKVLGCLSEGSVCK